MGQDPDVIRSEIEQTRAEMGETVDALGYKADVKTRTKENVQGKVESVKEKITGATGTMTDAAPSGEQMKRTGRQAVGVAQANPLGLAIGAAAIGFLAGMLIPETQKEHETFGEMADTVKHQVRDTASEALDRGKQVAQEVGQQTAQTAKETAQSAAQEHGSELKDSAAESAQQVRQQV